MKREPWPKMPGLWPYCGVRWLDFASRRLGDLYEAIVEHGWTERQLARSKRSAAP